jgi:hypothetical protein
MSPRQRTLRRRSSFRQDMSCAPFALNGNVITNTLPTAQIIMGIAMCHARSLNRDDEYATATEAKNAKKYGGPESRRVWFEPKPRDATIEGKKYVKDWTQEINICWKTSRRICWREVSLFGQGPMGCSFQTYLPVLQHKFHPLLHRSLASLISLSRSVTSDPPCRQPAFFIIQPRRFAWQ